MNKALTQQADPTVYKQLSKDPTNIYKNEIDDMIEEAYTINIITQETKKALINDHPRTPILYLVPKIHKDINRPSDCQLCPSSGLYYNLLQFIWKVFLQKNSPKTTMLP